MANGRLIDANALMDDFPRHMVERYDRNKCALEENCTTCEPGCLWRNKVSAAPTVDAVEVVHGRWEEDEPPKHYIFTGVDVIYRCSECNSRFVHDTHYCPNCGAKMDGGNEDG